jgi:hypothetical protein
MEAQTEPLKEILGELFALLEAQETNSVAVLQFLKDQGIATDEKLAPYLEQAGRASNVKWLAARRRMEYLLTPIEKKTTDVDKVKEKAQEAGPEKGKDKDKSAVKDNSQQAKALAQEPVQAKAGNQNQNDDKPAEKTESAGAEKPADSQTKTAKT